MKFLKKYKWKFLISLIIIVCIYIFRISILSSIGNYLIDIDEPQKSDVIYVLGGNSTDRGLKAAELFSKNISHEIVFTGGNWHDVLEYYGINQLESEVAQKVVIANGVPISNTRLIKQSTSTLEEKEEIIKDVKSRRYKSVTIVTDKFHSRRVRNLFEDELGEIDVELFIVGADNSKYNEEVWWEEERGLIMVNNEYMKSLYYFLKY